MVIDITWRKKEIRAWWVCFGSAFIRRTNSPAEVPHPGARPHIRRSLELPCLSNALFILPCLILSTATLPVRSPAFINLPEVLCLCVVTSVFWNFSGSLSGLFLPKAFQWTSVWDPFGRTEQRKLFFLCWNLVSGYWPVSESILHPFYPLKQQTRLRLKQHLPALIVRW